MKPRVLHHVRLLLSALLLFFSFSCTKPPIEPQEIEARLRGTVFAEFLLPEENLVAAFALFKSRLIKTDPWFSQVKFTLGKSLPRQGTLQLDLKNVPASAVLEFYSNLVDGSIEINQGQIALLGRNESLQRLVAARFVIPRAFIFGHNKPGPENQDGGIPVAHLLREKGLQLPGDSPLANYYPRTSELCLITTQKDLAILRSLHYKELPLKKP